MNLRREITVSQRYLGQIKTFLKTITNANELKETRGINLCSHFPSISPSCLWYQVPGQKFGRVYMVPARRADAVLMV